MTYRVLVVDDQEATNSVVTRYLEARGMRVDSAATGRDAVDMCRDGMPDAILMDVQMPVMDGLETTRLIRALPGGDRVAIVAFTALAMAGDRERCLAVGMTDYVSKPIRMAELYDRIVRVCETGHG
jgi:CheY-like chemotaxis protein